MSTPLTAFGASATILLMLMEVRKSSHARTPAVIVGVVLTLPVLTWLRSPGAGPGRDEWTSGRSEDTTGYVAASAVYRPLDSAEMSYDDLDYHRIQEPVRPAAGIAQKGTEDEPMKQVLKGKIYAAEQSAPGSVSRSHPRDRQ